MHPRTVTRPALLFAALACGAGIGGAARPALAQEGAEPPKNLTLQGITSATVAPRGLAFASLSLTDRRISAGPRQDGSMAFGLGLGSAEDAVGVQITGFVTSLTDNFGDSGYFEVKAARRISAGETPTYIALAINGAGFGDARRRETAGTVALTSFRQVRFSDGGPLYPMMFTLGAGTNERNAERDPGIFGGIGIGLTKNLGLSAAWSGEYVNLGAALRFDGLDNFSIGATLSDTFNQKNSRRIDVSFTYFLTDLF